MQESPFNGLDVRSFADGYRQYFRIVPASDDELKQHCFRIRHQVYCSELGFEPTRPDGLETDLYDASSIHCLIRATASQDYVGCARVVLTDAARREAVMPLEPPCDGHLHPDAAAFISHNRGRIGEVSRLAVTANYRRRRMEQDKPAPLDTSSGNGPRIRLPHLILSLYLALIAMGRERGIEHFYFLTDQALAKSIMRLGWELEQIGQPVEHHGERIPYRLDLGHTVANLAPPVRLLYETIQEEVAQARA